MPYAPRTHKPAGQEERKARERKEYDHQRNATEARQLYDRRWKEYSRWFRQRHPLCRACEAKGLIVPTEVTDHIEPHKGDREKFWNPDNHQPLCKRCHDVKTSKEGAWGREVQP